MRFLRDIIGMILVLMAWFNPFALDVLIRIALFILGFDALTIVPKVGIFLLNFFFPLFGEMFNFFSFTLLFLLLAELVILILKVYRPYNLILKPVTVFAASLLSIGLQPALIVAGTDLIINLTDKFKSKKRK